MSIDNQVADQVTIRENKLSLVERLADDLAHEIKNPLHSMVINLEVLRRRLARLDGEAGADMLRYAAVLSSELERVNRRVDLLLRMVRPHRDSEDPTTLSEVLEELRELVELECERHEVHWRLDPPTALLRARLPRSSTRQMVLSLILKTLDSIPPGGTLSAFTEVRDDWIQLHIRGHDTEAETALGALTGDHDDYLPVARALAERLGGTLEPQPPVSQGGLGDPESLAGYVLSLPRDGPPSIRTGTSGAGIG
ncbi:MAG: histidine kinase dimerization/phospho-acceptor domain-containing protein [Gemmatimonadota bacterium]